MARKVASERLSSSMVWAGDLVVVFILGIYVTWVQSWILPCFFKHILW